MPIDPHPPARLPRRGFLKTAAAAAVVGGAAVAGAGGAAGAATNLQRSRGARTGRAEPDRSRNLIFMVSDGMSFGTLTLADMVRRQREQRPSAWVSLFGRAGVRRGLYATHAADSLVTDSAASGSSWGSGRRVNNGVLNITPDGVQRLPLLVRARQAGRATGVVTTARVTHATPASFYANVARRDWEGPIAAQALERGVDVLLGGGGKFFKSDLLAAHAGVRVVRDRAALLAVGGGDGAQSARLLGLFADSHMPFELDRGETTPTLAEMTRAALHRLGVASEGFVLQVEGGRVDHAAHSNDAPSLIREQLAFDDALAEVLRFVDGGAQAETLVIVTTDHGNANPGLTVYGDEGRAGMDRLSKATHSFEWVMDRLSKVAAPDRPAGAARLLGEAMGIELDEQERACLADGLAGKRQTPFKEQSKLDPVLGGIMANHFGIGFVSGNHTADYVEVTALGPGSGPLAPSGHNADLHALIASALGLGEGELLPDMKDRVEFPKPPKPD